MALMRLITIFALALVAPAAMAFDATFSVDSVSSNSEHNAEYAHPIIVTLHFAEKVDGTATELTILVENRYGGQTPVTASDIAAKDIDSYTTGLQNELTHERNHQWIVHFKIESIVFLGVSAHLE